MVILPSNVLFATWVLELLISAVRQPTPQNMTEPKVLAHCVGSKEDISPHTPYTPYGLLVLRLLPISTARAQIFNVT